MGALRLRSTKFRREREMAWRQLEELVDRVTRRGLRSLSGAELLQLPRLYRSAISSLSVARAISLDKNVLEYLDALCQRAFFCVYGVRRHLWETLGRFFASDFPGTVRRFGVHVLLSAFALFAGAAAGFLLTSGDMDLFHSFVDPAMSSGRGPEASTESLRATLYRTGGDVDSLGAFASLLFTHNAKVGMLCFALGFVVGIPVFLLLFTNGLALGAFGALFASRGLGGEFWAWVLPHGVTEFLAVVLCGGAGLVLADALVFPGRYTRLQNLARRGRQAGIIVLGTIPMFLLAGLLEGFFRQLVHDVPIRFFVALVTVVFWLGYFGLVGRSRRRA